MTEKPDKSLDYWHGNAGQPLMPEPPPRRPVSVAPVEFDRLLTQTTDPAAAQAIRLALETSGIDVHQAEDGSISGGELRLLVRAADFEQAHPIAAAVQARREKFHSFPRQPRTGGDDPLTPLNDL